MKASIKKKLFMAVSALVVFYVLLSWLLNNLFLVDYYYLNKKSALKESYETINKIYQGEPFAILLDLDRLERTENLHIVVTDSSYNIKYVSSLKEEDYFRSAAKPPQENEAFLIIRAAIAGHSGKITVGQPVIQRFVDSRLNSEYINLMGVLNNGDVVFVSTPVVAIQESAGIANKFFLVTGLFTILTGFIAAFFFAGRLTKPILHLNDIAQRMAKLDFSKKYSIKGNDEIGELGDSINSLSDQLEKSISELRQANEKLLKDIEKERKIDEMRKEFISNVSHELKTPLALIQGYSEGLKLNVNESEEDKNFYCDVIMDETAKMNKLVKQLLELSQLDGGYLNLDRSEFNLAQLVNYVLKKYDPAIKENQINLDTSLEKDLVIDADADRIEQVVVNFLVNAINHVDDKKTIRVKVSAEKDKARLSVYNSGSSIPEEYREKIWESFYKVDKARTRSYGGTGLGLSIVRAIQELHNNRFGVENLPEGVEFWIEADLVQPGVNQ